MLTDTQMTSVNFHRCNRLWSRKCGQKYDGMYLRAGRLKEVNELIKVSVEQNEVCFRYPIGYFSHLAKEQ